MDAKWEPLVRTRKRAFPRGAVFRCPGGWPYEPRVDFMIVESAASESGFALMVVSGYKAGLTLFSFPGEARDPANPAISARWLKQHWQSHVYEHGPDGVFVAPAGYAIPPRWRGPAPTSN